MLFCYEQLMTSNRRLSSHSISDHLPVCYQRRDCGIPHARPAFSILHRSISQTNRSCPQHPRECTRELPHCQQQRLDHSSKPARSPGTSIFHRPKWTIPRNIRRRRHIYLPDGQNSGSTSYRKEYPTSAYVYSPRGTRFRGPR